jgi:DNA-binding FadR family transcriptional regulator
MSPPLPRYSLTEQAIEALRERIAGGVWPVGGRIPTGAELGATLGVGRNTVREATRALVHAGLLETRQGDGTYVRANSELAGAMRRRAASARTLEVLEVRRALETEAAALAAQRRTDDDLSRLEAARTERLARWEAGDIDGVVDGDLALHRAVVAAAHSPMLAELYDQISLALRDAIRHLTINRGVSDDDLASVHDKLIDAIRTGDAKSARAETIAYLERHIVQERQADR